MSALTTPDELDFDLDAARAARREKLKTPGLRAGGRRLELPIEFPVDVLAPLSDLDFDASVLVRMVLDARDEAKEAGENPNGAMLDSVLDILIANPNLPRELVEAVKTMAKRLFGEEGYNHLVGQRLAFPDLIEVARYIGRAYGVGLGEALQLSDSSESTGTTSSPTSSASTASTSAASGKSRARRGSSA